MTVDEKYMMRCLEIAKMGSGSVAPNPMVGCVIVNNEKIIGEGFHQKYGKAHAEVNAIYSAEKRHALSLPDSTLYVNLEPCSHFGKTPPCVDLILQKKIPKIVIGCSDTHKKVDGKGVEKLKNNGCDVTIGILEKESREINKRFFTFHEKERPYIILKWAQTLNGLITGTENGVAIKSQVSNFKSQILLHKWRTEEQALMVGTNTAIIDNPMLNVREWSGKGPIRIVIDKTLRLSPDLHLFDQTQPTIVFTSKKRSSGKNLFYLPINFNENIIPQVLSELYKRQIQSLIVEGGTQLLNSFILSGLWDEARVFTAKKTFSKGVKAPEISGTLISKEKIGEDDLMVFRNSPSL